MKNFSLSRPMPFVSTLLRFLITVWLVLLAMRVVMLALVWPEASATVNGAGAGLVSGMAGNWRNLALALYTGAKFDARLAVFMTIPLGLVLALPWAENRLRALRFVLDGLYSLVFLAVTLVYVVDYGYFFYMHQRVDATVLDFLHDATISFDMVWQTYPVVWISLGLAVLVVLYARLFDRLLLKHMVLMHREGLRTENLWNVAGESWKPRALWSLLLFVGLFLVAYGQISSNLFPLRWSNAYFTTDRNMVILALNPVQNLRDTLSAMRVVRPDRKAVTAAYDNMATWLGLPAPDKAQLVFQRDLAATPVEQRPNVVVILMESLSWPMTSFAPGPEDPTPNVKRIAADGLYFSRFFAPARTTARAIFTLMTGIPDANREGGTTSRNQALVDQNLAMNSFTGYEKRYLLGGSASWANIRGLLTHNVKDLILVEEGDWQAPNVDVWGISDLALFREAVGVFNKAEKPFVAVVQTAGFHRPFTIPEDNAGFVTRSPSAEALRNYGFESAEEYNSLRFSDHALGEFFKAAASEPWFANTIFAIVGDHGLSNASTNVPAGYRACGLQSHHVPFVLYAPGRVQPGQKDFPAGHTDIFPTVAALAGVPLDKYQALGRNLLDPHTEATAKQFIAGGSELFWRMVEDGFCYKKEAAEALYRLDDPEGKNLLTEEPERAERMRKDAADFYNTSKYLLFNNQK